LCEAIQQILIKKRPALVEPLLPGCW